MIDSSTRNSSQPPSTRLPITAHLKKEQISSGTSSGYSQSSLAAAAAAAAAGAVSSATASVGAVGTNASGVHSRSSVSPSQEAKHQQYRRFGTPSRLAQGHSQLQTATATRKIFLNSQQHSNTNRSVSPAGIAQPSTSHNSSHNQSKIVIDNALSILPLATAAAVLPTTTGTATAATTSTTPANHNYSHNTHNSTTGNSSSNLNYVNSVASARADISAATNNNNNISNNLSLQNISILSANSQKQQQLQQHQQTSRRRQGGGGGSSSSSQQWHLQNHYRVRTEAYEELSELPQHGPQTTTHKRLQSQQPNNTNNYVLETPSYQRFLQQPLSSALATNTSKSRANSRLKDKGGVPDSVTKIYANNSDVAYFDASSLMQQLIRPRKVAAAGAALQQTSGQFVPSAATQSRSRGATPTPSMTMSQGQTSRPHSVVNFRAKMQPLNTEQQSGEKQSRRSTSIYPVFRHNQDGYNSSSSNNNHNNNNIGTVFQEITNSPLTNNARQFLTSNRQQNSTKQSYIHSNFSQQQQENMKQSSRRETPLRTEPQQNNISEGLNTSVQPTKNYLVWAQGTPSQQPSTQLQFQPLSSKNTAATQSENVPSKTPRTNAGGASSRYEFGGTGNKRINIFRQRRRVQTEIDEFTDDFFASTTETKSTEPHIHTFSQQQKQQPPQQQQQLQQQQQSVKNEKRSGSSSNNAKDKGNPEKNQIRNKIITDIEPTPQPAFVPKSEQNKNVKSREIVKPNIIQTQQEETQNLNSQLEYDMSDEEWQSFGDRFPENFRKICILGRGGFALVWLGESERNHTKYAVKQILSKNVHQTHLKEIWFASHFFEKGQPKVDLKYPKGLPNIIKLVGYDVQEVDTWLFYELSGKSLGGNLYDLVGDNDCPSTSTEEIDEANRIYRILHKDMYLQMCRDLSLVKQLIMELAQAIELISSQGLVHSDLKTENILVKPRYDPRNRGRVTCLEEVKLIDYGSAFPFGDLKGFTMATPEYMAPEVLNYILLTNKMNYNSDLLVYLDDYTKPWVIDIWSLGCVLLELVNGIPLWMSLKTKITYQGKDIIRHGLFAVKNRVFEGIIAKQCETVEKLETVLRDESYSGMKLDAQLKTVLQGMLKINPNERLSPKQVIEILSNPNNSPVQK